MKTLRLVCFILILGYGSRSATGQSFVNLGFENTTITTVHFPGGDRYAATIPGWSWNTFNFLNGDPNSVGLNDIALNAPATTLHGLNSRFFPAIRESYSVLLQGGSTPAEMGTNGASIFQTGQVPLGSQSMTYSGGSSLQVSFAGQMLVPIALSNGANYTVWGADISAYAGQTGELRFTAPWRTVGVLDGIQFSSTAIPEPSAFALLSLGLFCLFGRLRRPSRNAPH